MDVDSVAEPTYVEKEEEGCDKGVPYVTDSNPVFIDQSIITWIFVFFSTCSTTPPTSVSIDPHLNIYLSIHFSVYLCILSLCINSYQLHDFESL